MHYSLHPHIYFTHSTYLLRASPYSDNSHPLCLCFSFFGLCLCITRCTLTFILCIPPTYCAHLPYVIVSHPYVFVSHFWACVYALIVAPSHLLHAAPMSLFLIFGPVFYVYFMHLTHYSCTLLLLFCFLLLSFLLLIFFL